MSNDSPRPTFLATCEKRISGAHENRLWALIQDQPGYSISRGSPERNQPAYTLCYQGPREHADRAIILGFCDVCEAGGGGLHGDRRWNSTRQQWEYPPFPLPTPWRVALRSPNPHWRGDGTEVDSDYGRIADCACSGLRSEQQARANAAFIVRAVNAHDDLVAALERVRILALSAANGAVSAQTLGEALSRLADEALAKVEAA